MVKLGGSGTGANETPLKSESAGAAARVVKSSPGTWEAEVADKVSVIP
jgi:hypothetical protein